MWNRNSLRWLVKDKSNIKRRPPTKITWQKQHTSLQLITATPNNNGSVVCKRQLSHKSRSLTKMKYPPRQSRLSSSSSSTMSTCDGKQNCRKLKPQHSSPCLNQKLEVLLVILLANCCLPQMLAYEMMPSSSATGYSRNFLKRSNLIIAEPESFSNNVDDLQTSSDTLYLHRSQNFKISPKPCSVGSIEGTCMFVWECIKSEGRHVGMCVDSFMFGSCCAHNYTDNIVLPQIFSYTRPTKPVGVSSFNHRPRPPHTPHKPSTSGLTTIERPHGAGTLVIRPSGPHHQGVLHHKPSRPSTATTTTARPTWSSHVIASNDLQAAESISSSSVSPSNSWPSPAYTINQQHHQHWQMSTEPNFITKPRPPNWDKPTILRPKPSKPSKKPTASPSSHQQHHHHNQQHHQHNQHHTTMQHLPTSSSIVYSTRRPKPTPSSSQMSTPTKQKPQHSPQQQNNVKPSTLGTTSNQYLRPTTPSWLSSSASSSSHKPTSPDTSSTHQYRPTTLAPATSHWTSATSSSHRPTAASSLSPLEATTQPLDPITIESNEILDSHMHSKDGNIPTVKTVSAAKTAECGIPLLTRPETRIVGGKSAAFGRWPWQVSVRRTSFFGFSSTHRCGGALINENWIATAGHCVDDLLTSQIRIRVGEYDFSHVQEQLPYIERGVAAKVVHPKYNFFTYEYDLALVKLEQSLEFAPHVSPICLPQTDSLLIGMNATVTGWGRLSEGGTLPSVLQEVSVPIVSNDNCKSMFLRAGRQEFIPDIFLCAGYETGGQDSCQGDSGGPLQVKSQDGRFFLAGIISWGIGCAEANLPGVCTRISKFVPWILEHVT